MIKVYKNILYYFSIHRQSQTLCTPSLLINEYLMTNFIQTFLSELSYYLYLYKKREIMLSKTCEYAIRAMIYIAQNSTDGKMINIKEISENIASPELFIGKILQGLSKQGFLQSSKGRYGGFYISEKQAQSSLADIIIAIDGDKIFKGCGVGLDYCSEKNPCPIHAEYKHTRKELYNIYKKATLSQFKTNELKQKIFLKRI